MKMGFALIIVLIAAGGMVYGISQGLSQHAWLKNAWVTNGKVIEMVERSSGEGGTTYAPKVRFITALGQSVEFVASMSSSPPDFRVGNKSA